MIPTDGSRARGSTLLRGGVTDARVAAADIMADLRGGDLLDAALDRRASGLDARDRRWVQELVYGTLRRRALLDAYLADRVRGGLARLDADLTDILRLGVYQLLHMRSVPPYAAIAQSVELAKRRHGIGASKLANAVLRRVDREREDETPSPSATGLDPIDQLALQGSHPRWLVARWAERWGMDETRALLDMNNTEAPMVLRPWGLVREQLEATLEGSGVQVEDAPLVEDGLAVAGHVALAEVGAFRQGLFFVQDPAATLVTRYAAIPPGATVIDLCAAPGGKSFELARTASVVIACDRSPARLERMRQNVQRLDARNVTLVATDARETALSAVDAVLVDAPCTGTGTFRRHPDARWRLRVSDLAVSGAAQRAILRAAAALVRAGGLLIYSTCSLEPEENDAQVTQFLAEHPDFQLEPPPAGTVPESTIDAGMLRVIPQRHGADGAFAARLRRSAG
ncbi:MAG: 16S rRNA (cytosine(967)-C(5))-methyltransferase RsmB [Gemmatimonadetes bacterium]|jgi:16S rRNA (cytosine967-C5)-methyltransferase|nr:16S rRNA (cytosine(967)-C(5))-methyltransferase RsmB [Gemmatimonadota bacterium]MBK9977615.1 16S rRNA (cytosine(967)-C(5))-methyltransferase RsmB [Gemmatimonadota bacterium]